jgi:Tol biopolymer transport system component
VTRPHSIALAACLLALAVPSGAFGFGQNKIAYETFDWQIYKSPHFDVYYYPEEADHLEQVVSYAESQYTRLAAILDHEIIFRIRFIYYRTHVEFEQTNITLGFIPEFVAAFAEPIANRMVLPVDMPPDQLYALIGHELTHVFQFSILFQESVSRAFRANTPTWITEGMASYLGEDEDNFDRMIIRDAVVNGLIPPIHRLNVLSFLTYRYGHAAFEFIEEKYGQEGVRTFVWEFRRNLLSNNIAKPIKDAFGIEAEEFDRQFKKWIQRKYLPDLLERKEAEDYGREIKTAEQRDRGEITVSPALSPSGELIAVITTRWEDIDVAILSAHDGEVIRNLTKGFTNKWEYVVTGAFEGKKDLTWSPDGDRVAFFARRENERVLLIYNAVRGKLERKLSIAETDDELSPAWSPAGDRIAFEGFRDGAADIFTYDINSGEVRNLTQDTFFDGNPSWSPDGSQVLYNRRIGPHRKIFMVDAADPTRKIQLTFGDHSDLQPSFSRDANTVYYTSDMGGDTFNLHSLSLDSGEIRRHTDILGGIFTPLELPGDDDGGASLAFTSYGKGRFRLFRMRPGEPEEILRPIDQASEPATLEPFEPPLQLTLDDDARSSYDKLKFHIDNVPAIYVGVANDGTILSNATLMLSDLLGDHRVLFNFQSVSSFSNFYIEYMNLKQRFNWSVYGRDYRDFFLAQSINTGNVSRDRQASSTTLVGARFTYPFNRYYGAGISASYVDRSVTTPFQDVTGTIQFPEVQERFPVLGWHLSGDTTRWKEFGAYHGQGFHLQQDYSPTVSASGGGVARDGSFVNTFIDYRMYRKVSSRSLFALRLVGAASNGEAASFYAMGGLNQLRGWEYREFFGSKISFFNLEYRFPLVDAIQFPFGAIRNVRAFFFLDIGTAWMGADQISFGGTGDTFYHPNFGFDIGVTSNGQLVSPTAIAGGGTIRTFDFWDSKNNELGDGRASWGVGWNFWLGPFQLTWSFARQFDNTWEVCEIDPGNPSTCNLTRVPDPFQASGTVSEFYIAREF